MGKFLAQLENFNNCFLDILIKIKILCANLF